MPKFNFEIPHTLTVGEARERLQRFTEALHTKFQDQVSELEQSWEDDTLAFGFKTFGIKIQGKIKLHEDRLTVDADLPFSAMMFKGKIESEMRQQLERLLR